MITGGYATGSFTSPCGPACGGGIYVIDGSPQFNNLAVRGNLAGKDGGGIALLENSANVVLLNTSIQGNRAAFNGGGLYQKDSSFSATNAVFSGNRSYDTGGAIYSYVATTPITLTNTTISGNRARFNGGAVANRVGTILLENSIIWNNISNNAPTIYNNNGGTISAQSSLLENAYATGSWDSSWGTDAGNNLDIDPLFISPIDVTATPTHTGDLRLDLLSPAADAGDSTLNGTVTDIDKQPRVQGASIDLGAYESTIPHN